MKSIRLSLVLCFLVLLAAALAAVSWSVYQTTHLTLLDKKATTQRLLEQKEASTRQLLQAQYEDHVQEERTKLEKALLSQAQMLGALAKAQSQWARSPVVVAMSQAGLLAAGLSPSGVAAIPIWVAEGGGSPLSYQIHHVVDTRIEFNEDDLPRYADGQVAEYIQINTEMGTTWRSKSLGKRAFSFDPEQLKNTSAPIWQFDEFQMKPGEMVLRITLKAPSQLRWRYSPDQTVPPSSSPARSRKKQPLVGSSDREWLMPITILIQVACETRLRDEAIAKLAAEKDNDLARLESDLQVGLIRLDWDSQETLKQLRFQLLGIALATFAATVLSGFWLVRLGLLPLRRLSEAVSKISEKDFRLRIHEHQLPTELQPIAERLKQTLEQLRRAFAREKQAAADISHELRTPLAALLTTIEVALRRPRSPEEYRDILSDCHAAGKQMSHLVERLLTLARLDAGVDTLRLRSVDVAALAEQCTALVRPLAEARGLKLQVHCPGPAPLTADPDKLREVLTNLLHNAIEYNKPDGSVDLTVARDNGTLCVEVSDTGVGISPEARQHIFERFYRADAARKADGLHAGLGLAIVKGYIDLMGGRIAVE